MHSHACHVTDSTGFFVCVHKTAKSVYQLCHIYLLVHMEQLKPYHKDFHEI
jgi:hypothetical protein